MNAQDLLALAKKKQAEKIAESKLLETKAETKVETKFENPLLALMMAKKTSTSSTSTNSGIIATDSKKIVTTDSKPESLPVTPTTTTTPASKSNLLALLNKVTTPATPTPIATAIKTDISNSHSPASVGVANSVSSPEINPQNLIQAPVPKLNEKQSLAVQLALAGRSFCLIGAAGSGKTTTIAEIINLLSKNYGILDVSIVAYTRKAANNVKVAMAKHPELSNFFKDGNKISFVSTIHRLLGFKPETYMKVDIETGRVTESMKFVPTFTANNPLNKKVIVIDEGSMVNLDLFKQLWDANPNAIFIFIGDINQLPPAFGDAILGYALARLPVIELTEIYRQALESPIVKFQHDLTLKGLSPSTKELKLYNLQNKAEGKLVDGLPPIRFVDYKPAFDTKKFELDEVNEKIVRELGGFFNSEIIKGAYNPESDIILIPQNVGVGTILLNKQIANILDKKNSRPVYEIFVSFTKLYFAVGDKVMYDKDDFIIEEIIPNGEYKGATPREPAVGILRCGLSINETSKATGKLSFEETLAHMDAMDKAEDDDGIAQASHSIILRSKIGNETKTISSVSELRALELAYAITVYKSQGSEWDRVYFILLNKHARMIDRETLYTGMTRAKKNLTLVYSPDTYENAYNNTIAKAIASPVIKGTNLKDKLKQFTKKSQEFQAKMGEDVFGRLLSKNGEDSQTLY